jgi:hypothetical protein
MKIERKSDSIGGNGRACPTNSRKHPEKQTTGLGSTVAAVPMPSALLPTPLPTTVLTDMVARETARIR